METHNCNLNIHYSAPPMVWIKLEEIYKKMPYWQGFVDGCPQWYGMDGKLITASIEPSGLQFYACLPQLEWQAWLEKFKMKASQALKYEVGEPEAGVDFPAKYIT